MVYGGVLDLQRKGQMPTVRGIWFGALLLLFLPRDLPAVRSNRVCVTCKGTGKKKFWLWD